MNKEEFVKEVGKLGILINEDKLNQLEHFYELLVAWNEKINLTRIISSSDVYLKHFYDSLTLMKTIDLNKPLTLCDVGTGAGFPGIVLKIVFPNLQITLIDALEKRVNYLKNIINSLSLKGINVFHARSEDYARNNYEKFDIVVARAVANLRILTEICTPLVKVNGYFIAMKGNVVNEVNDSLNIIKKLNCQIVDMVEFKLPYEDSVRNLIKIEKMDKTPRKYPRSFREIKKSN